MNESQDSINSISKSFKVQPLTFEEIIETINHFIINSNVDIPENLDFIV